MKRLAALCLMLALAALGCSPPPSGGMRPSSTDKSDAGGGKNDKSGKSNGSSGSQSGGQGSAGGSGGSGPGSTTGGSNSSSSSSPTMQTAVEITPEQQRLGGIRVAELEPVTIPRTLSVPAQVMMDEEHTAHISPYFDGRVIDVLKYPGEPVRRGAVLAHVHSHSVHETVGALAMDYSNQARAQAVLAYAQAKRDRYNHLYSIQAASLEQQQSSTQELVAAQTEVANANAAIIQEREHLADLLQIEPAQVTPATLYTYENLPLKSPIAGTVITRSITPGMTLTLGQEAYTVSDLGEVWVVAAANEADLPFLRLRQRVLVRTQAWPNETFPGRVTLIGSTLDPATRTVQVRASVPNPQGKLKPQMFATATIDETTSREALFIPESALQDVNGVSVAFVTPDGTHFTPHALKTASPVNGQVEVTEGLRPGDHVAVSGAFMLKSALLKSSMDSD